VPACTGIPPASPSIADFASSAPASSAGDYTFSGVVAGGTYRYGNATPTVAISGGALAVTQHITPATTVDYTAVGLWFNACTDASAYRGISFSINGTAPGCTVSFSVPISQDSPVGYNPNNACTASSCYSPSATLAAAALDGSPHTIALTFDQLTNAGTPVPQIGTQEKKSVVDVEWQMRVSGTSACTASFTVDNVQFFQ